MSSRCIGPSSGPEITTEMTFLGVSRSTGLDSLATSDPTFLSIVLRENPGIPTPSLRVLTAKLPSGRCLCAHSAIFRQRSSCDALGLTQYLPESEITSSRRAALDSLSRVESIKGTYSTLGLITSIGPVSAWISALNNKGCQPLPTRVRPCIWVPRLVPRRASSLNASTVTVDQHRRGESENGLQLT